MLNGRQQKQQQQRPGLNPVAVMNAVGLLVHVWATSAEVLLHKKFGDRYIGLQAAAVVLLIPFYAVFWAGHDLRLLMWFLPVYLLGVVIARIDIFMRRMKGTQIHSRYSGYPRCMTERTKMTEMQCKRFFEPVFTALAGLTLCLLGELPLGVYLLIAGACLHLSVTMSEMHYHRGAAGMNDQVLEQEYVAERFREMQEGRL